MIEYANRYNTTYHAAKGGNWDLAAYQIKEMREIQQVGETIRPARKAGLIGFEKSHLDPLDTAVKAKDWKKFDSASRQASPPAMNVTLLQASLTSDTSFRSRRHLRYH